VATTPEGLLGRLAAGLRQVLGDELLSLSVHGSWVAGDFKPGRSDLDLLAVLARDPDERTLARLAVLHEAISAEAPEWDDHVEVDYVSVEAVEGVLARDGRQHHMVRISPGEPLHLLSAQRHYLLNWRAARDHDHAVTGRSPVEVLPPIPDDAVREVVVEHARQWPAWLTDTPSPGFSAYAVLTMCRVLAFLRTGRQTSKHRAAVSERELMPEWRGLISWADDWWYGNSSDLTPPRTGDVTAFVRSASQLAVEKYGEEEAPVGSAP
jgi:aminoglycoside adenylyltransferase-like protein